MIAVEPNVTLTSIATVSDVLGVKADGVTPCRFVGIPDGMGAFDNNDGTITVLINHEIRSTQSVIREHRAIGSFVSQRVIDKTTLAVRGAQDAIKSVQRWNDATDSFTPPPSRSGGCARPTTGSIPWAPSIPRTTSPMARRTGAS